MEWFRGERDNISIARLGKRMDARCERLGQGAFRERLFGARMMGMNWREHVMRSSLVAGNFALLTLPRTPQPGAFDFVIADEVSMANIPSLAVASYYAESALVVGGDPNQLPPIFPEDAEEPNDWFKKNIFEIAEVKDPADSRAAFLDIQYRMQKEIGELVSRMFYENRLRTGAPSVNPLGGYGARVVFVHCPGRVEMVGEKYIREEEQRRYNETHAHVAAVLAHQAVRDGYPPAEVGIIAPYNAQVVKIDERLGLMGLRGADAGRKLKVSTVHSFQGQERRVIVLDITDDNIQPTPLTAKRELINVALSRAKEQLIIIGNREYLLDEEYFSYEEIEMFEKMLAAARVVSIKKETVS
jgi:superfamily I DNA and/or RNA helicase